MGDESDSHPRYNSKIQTRNEDQTAPQNASNFALATDAITKILASAENDARRLEWRKTNAFQSATSQMQLVDYAEARCLTSDTKSMGCFIPEKNMLQIDASQLQIAPLLNNRHFLEQGLRFRSKDTVSSDPERMEAMKQLHETITLNNRRQIRYLHGGTDNKVILCSTFSLIPSSCFKRAMRDRTFAAGFGPEDQGPGPEQWGSSISKQIDASEVFDEDRFSLFGISVVADDVMTYLRSFPDKSYNRTFVRDAIIGMTMPRYKVKAHLRGTERDPEFSKNTDREWPYRQLPQYAHEITDFGVFVGKIRTRDDSALDLPSSPRSSRKLDERSESSKQYGKYDEWPKRPVTAPGRPRAALNAPNRKPLGIREARDGPTDTGMADLPPIFTNPSVIETGPRDERGFNIGETKSNPEPDPTALPAVPGASNSGAPPVDESGFPTERTSPAAISAPEQAAASNGVDSAKWAAPRVAAPRSGSSGEMPASKPSEKSRGIAKNRKDPRSKDEISPAPEEVPTSQAVLDVRDRKTTVNSKETQTASQDEDNDGATRGTMRGGGDEDMAGGGEGGETGESGGKDEAGGGGGKEEGGENKEGGGKKEGGETNEEDGDDVMEEERSDEALGMAGDGGGDDPNLVIASTATWNWEEPGPMSRKKKLRNRFSVTTNSGELVTVIHTEMLHVSNPTKGVYVPELDKNCKHVLISFLYTTRYLVPSVGLTENASGVFCDNKRCHKYMLGQDAMVKVAYGELHCPSPSDMSKIPIALFVSTANHGSSRSFMNKRNEDIETFKEPTWVLTDDTPMKKTGMLVHVFGRGIPATISLGGNYLEYGDGKGSATEARSLGVVLRLKSLFREMCKDTALLLDACRPLLIMLQDKTRNTDIPLIRTNISEHDTKPRSGSKLMSKLEFNEYARSSNKAMNHVDKRTLSSSLTAHGWNKLAYNSPHIAVLLDLILANTYHLKYNMAELVSSLSNSFRLGGQITLGNDSHARATKKSLLTSLIYILAPPMKNDHRPWNPSYNSLYATPSTDPRRPMALLAGKVSSSHDAWQHDAWEPPGTPGSVLTQLSGEHFPDMNSLKEEINALASVASMYD